MPDEALPPPPPPPPSDPLPPLDEPPQSDRTLMLMLSYLGPLSLVPILAEKSDAEVQWHAKNGLVLFAAAAVVAMIGVFLFTILHIYGCVSMLFGVSAALIYGAFVAIGISRALRGERLVITGLTDLAGRL